MFFLMKEDTMFHSFITYDVVVCKHDIRMEKTCYSGPCSCPCPCVGPNPRGTVH